MSTPAIIDHQTMVFKEIDSVPVYLTLGVAMVVFIIAIFLIIHNFSVFSTSKILEASYPPITHTIIFSFIIMIILLITITMLPALKALKEFISQIKDVNYLVIYTIIVILFFTLTPSNILNYYPKALLLISTFITFLIMIKVVHTNYVTKYDINYEITKTVILFICTIIIFFIYYLTDPGGVITQYFSYAISIASLISIFTLLYIIVLITSPAKELTSAVSNERQTFFQKMFKSSIVGTFSLSLFIIVILLSIYYTTGFAKFVENSTVFTSTLILTLIVTILWIMLIIIKNFANITQDSDTINNLHSYKHALLMLFGVTMAIITVAWVICNINHLPNASVSTLLSILIFIIALAIVYKIFITNLPIGNDKKNAFFRLLINVIFYIPCLFSDIFDYIMKLFITEYNTTTSSSLLILLIAIILLLLYFVGPVVFNKLNLQGGQLLVNHPVYSNGSYVLGTYKDLNGTDNFDYNYAISFWFYLDATPSSSSLNPQTYDTLLNYGNKPRVSYNVQKHTLMVTMANANSADGSTTLYKNTDVLLQKWNNMIINYTGGTLDIFLNGDLVKSASGIVPYYKLDNLTIGENNGANGGICNVVYFNKSLTSNNIYYLYNLAKKSTPPILEESNYTIIKQKLTIDTPNIGN